MVEAFKTINTKNGNTETLYAVIMKKTMTKEEAYKEVAAYKKESLKKVLDKYKDAKHGYMITENGRIWLYEGITNRTKGITKCIIVRR